MLHSFWISSVKIISKSSFRNKCGNAVMSGVEDGQCSNNAGTAQHWTFLDWKLTKTPYFSEAFRGMEGTRVCPVGLGITMQVVTVGLTGVSSELHTVIYQGASVPRCSLTSPSLSRRKGHVPNPHPRICRIHGDVDIFKTSCTLGIW